MTKNHRKSFAIGHYLFMILSVWCLVAIVAGFWIHKENQKVEKTQVMSMARMGIEKDIVFRRWAAQHGGVYVPVTENTPPNPWLNVPERDISTPSGRKLTLANPAYMIRQVFEVGQISVTSPREHITSLKPIRPENGPDPWEARALRLFESGAMEFGEKLVKNGEPVYRYMRPLITEKSCLKCHAAQGYREGMVRGGISISIPMKEFELATKHNNAHDISIIAFIWLVGVVGILLGFRRFSAATAALVGERDNLDVIFDTAPLPLLLFDAEQRVVRTNATFRAFCTSFKAWSDKSEYRCCLQPILPEPSGDSEVRDKSAFGKPYCQCSLMENLRQIVATDPQDGSEIRIAAKIFADGPSEIWLRYNVERVNLSGCEHRLLSFVDISVSRQMQEKLLNQAALLEEEIEERNRAERELRLLNQAVNQSADAIFLLDDRQRFVYVNETACRKLGYSRDELLHMTSFDIDPDLTPEQAIRLQQKLILPSHAEIFRTRHRSRDGRTFPVEVSSSLCSHSGIEMSLAIARDISEQQQLEVQLRQAQKMEAIGQLAGGVAHDFNNMLSVILGRTGVAMSKLDSGDPLFAHLEEIRKAAERSAGLTRQLLGYSRKQPIAPKVLDLNQTVEGMLQMLHRLIGENIELHWLPEATEATLKIDPAQLDQILVNLCVNARDAIAGVGTLAIETRTMTVDETFCEQHPEARTGDFIVLTVTDTGCGMDAETLDRIFEPFFTTKEVGKGTGLGLATVYGIVKQNQGFIYVDSESGRGTTFKIYLPRHEYPPELPHQKEQVIISRSTEEQTILLVEDEPAILNISRQILSDSGYQVLAATSPAEGLRIATEINREIHLLLTDVIMPGMNGLELANQLRTLYPDIRCLYMTGYSDDCLSLNGMPDGDVSILPKPFSLQTLTEKVHEVLTELRFA